MYNPFKRIKELEKANSLLSKAFNESTTSSEPTVKGYLEAMFEKGIEWFDYHTLEYAERQNYWSKAQALTTNTVFVNEMNAFKTSIIKDIAMNTRDINEVMSKRQLIIGLESFVERIKGIESPNQPESMEEIHEPI